MAPEPPPEPPEPPEPETAPPPFPDSLCHRCLHVRLTGNKRGSIFLSCTHPALPKYLPQPVLRCGGFSPRP